MTTINFLSGLSATMEWDGFFQSFSVFQNNGEDPKATEDEGAPVVDGGDGNTTSFHRDHPDTTSSKEMSQQQAEEDVGAIISGALNSMSLQEREKATFDIHGVSDLIEETPELIKRSLEEFDDILIQHQKSHMGTLEQQQSESAYMRALRQNPEVFQSDSFRLKFLRAEQFRVQGATNRMLRHFEEKEGLWGTDRLGQDITQDDFDAQEIEMLKNGIIQVLPMRDRAGRAIIFHKSPAPDVPPASRAKAFFYACMQLALDEEIQKHGIIVLTSVADRKKSMTDLVSVTLCTRIVRSCPIRVCVLHVLMKKSSPLMQNAVPYLRFIRNAEGVSRIRFHHGSWMETQYELLTYGIPVATLPLDQETGTFQVDKHLKWLENCRVADQERERHLLSRRGNKTFTKHGTTSDDTSSSVMSDYQGFVIPKPQDVLFGKEKGACSHQGNVRYLTIISERWNEYDAASKETRREIIFDIIDSIQIEHGGRFLKHDTEIEGGRWRVVSDRQVLKTKVMNAFRDKRKAILRAQERERKLPRSTTSESSSSGDAHEVDDSTTSRASVTSGRTSKKPRKKKY